VKKIYVGNLSWNTTDDTLKQHFEAVGTVHSASVITDRDSGRSRGFGFVEMDEAGAARAISELDGRELDSRALRVNEANERGSGGGGGGGGGGGRW